jgi:asparagine synthase (glutamine-hydrolysing)
MCGIFGFVSQFTSKNQLVSATDKLTKRGPDNAGYFFNSPIGLGHRRLSIIDLNSGNQPIHSDDGARVLIFNGEIYNFKKIKSELENLGVCFKTNSDTEVILEAYIIWGLEICLNKLEGMFAFALWDENLKKLYVVRDRFGEKPLYYTSNSKGFFFASELKALSEFYDKSVISKNGLNLFFSLTYIPAPYTIYENVFKLEAGNYLEIDTEINILKKSYYDLLEIVKISKNSQITDYESAKNQLRKKLFESVEERMVSDVPLGSFLSGGIDSSIVSAIMANISSKPIKTFSIGFKEKDYDESDRAELVANHIGSEHTLHILGHEDLLKVVDETLSYFDEPFGDSSAIPSMMVAKKAREKVTVVLTGDCADELFGGYEKYLGAYYSKKYISFPIFIRKAFEALIKIIPHTSLTNHTLRKIKKVIQSSNLLPSERYLNLVSLGYNSNDKTRLLSSNWCKPVENTILKFFNQLGEFDELTRTFFSDVKLILEGDMLAKVDRACMINSLEARVPFLDSSMLALSYQFPHEFKILGTNKKRILKETFSDLLPKETFKFSKRGFGIPIRIWFKNELKNELISVLNKPFIETQGIFNQEYIDKLLVDHLSGKENNSPKLWLLFVFQKWYQKNFNE